MIYAYLILAAIAVAIGFTVAALAGLVVQHLREEAVARLYAANDEAIALTRPGALGKARSDTPIFDAMFTASVLADIEEL